MHLDLIVGLPFDYWNDIKNSFEEVFKLFPPELQLGFLKFLKGTPVRDKYLNYGYVFDEMAPYQIIKSNYLSEQELATIVKLEHALEIYWNKKRLVHTLTYVTNQYSVFDFLLELGKFFEQHSSFYSYSSLDIYTIVHGFIEQHYTSDLIMLQLLAIDYYLQHKVKPVAYFITEIEKKEKFALLEKLKLSHHKFRYTVITIDFDYNLFLQEHTITPTQQLLIIEYTGTGKPKVIHTAQYDHLQSSAMK
jgi:hypothetical protein